MIILYTPDTNIKYAYLNIYPDQFKTEKEKIDDKSWIKNTMDYFATKAYSSYVHARQTYVKNYDLVKGILRREDFFEEPEIKAWIEPLTKDLDLPSYVKHYNIMSVPLNELSGELTKRPDGYRVKAFDDDSKSEELQYKTDLLNQYILSEAKSKIQEKLELQEDEYDEEQLNQLTLEEVQGQIEAYTSTAEKWANHVLTAVKADLNLKEIKEDSFRDLNISARPRIHIYEDNSNLGFNVECVNPKNTWRLTIPDRQSISDPTGRQRGDYAAGTVKVMEISEIIERFNWLTKEEIDHLRKSLENFGLVNVRESNLTAQNVVPGPGSIKYDTYDPLVMQERMLIDSELKENNDSLRDWLGLTNNPGVFGYKYVVIESYFISKRKIGKVTWEDELGNIQSKIVDENYISGTISTEISLEWGWINQWYKGYKIGPDIYHIAPFNLFNYCPLFGIDWELKNTEAKSFVDMMKPFQVLYNVCLNQLYDLFKKEIGNIPNVNIRRIPKLKDADDQDAIDVWMMEAKDRGVMFDDDSPENTKAPVSNTSVAKSIDLTRSNEMNTRIAIADWLKAQCWELVGMNRERLGKSQASATATASQSNLQQSYAQTEPLFVAHEYLMGQVYQGIIDAALYIEGAKPQSTLSYITNQGESAFVQINGSDLKLRDLKIFTTNRPEDRENFQQIRDLMQPLLQNGGGFLDVIEVYSTDSMRQMKSIGKRIDTKLEQVRQENMQLEQQKLQDSKEIKGADIQYAQYLEDKKMINDNYQNDLDRASKERIAIISATGFGKVESEDLNQNQVPDVLETEKLNLDRETAIKDYQIKMQEVQGRLKESEDKKQIELEKLKNEKLNMANDLQIARINLKGRQQKSTSKKKKK